MHSGIATTRTSHGDTSLLFEGISLNETYARTRTRRSCVFRFPTVGFEVRRNSIIKFQDCYLPQTIEDTGPRRRLKNQCSPRSLRRLNHSVPSTMHSLRRQRMRSTAEGDRAGCKRNKSAAPAPPYPEYDFLTLANTGLNIWWTRHHSAADPHGWACFKPAR